jgi:hypothetical protein
MRLPWKRQEPAVELVPFDWIESRAWLSWDPPRNYIAGEASYKQSLRKLTGPPRADGYCVPVVVRLVREPTNSYDANAIRADVSGACIGYLRRHLAAQLAPVLDRAKCSEFTVPGLLRGGSTAARNVGCHVWLDRSMTVNGPSLTLPREDEWIVPWPVNAWERPG